MTPRGDVAGDGRVMRGDTIQMTSTQTGTDETAVTVADLARLLRKSPDTIYRLARAGAIPGFKVGGEWRFFKSAVLEHLTRPPEPLAQSQRSRQAKRITD